MSVKLGLNCKLYRNDTGGSGTYASPDWLEIENVKDLTIALSKDEADATTRANGGWKAVAGSLKDGSISFQMIDKPGDADLDAIRDAWLNGTQIDAAALNDAVTTSGAEGIRAWFEVVTFGRTENLADVSMYS